MQLVLSYPWWFVFLCLLTGGFYAYLLYFRKTSFTRHTNRLLFALRFLSISLLAFLLLAPIVIQKEKKYQKPILLFALDNSISVVENKDSGYLKNKFLEQWQKAQQELESNYEIHNIFFGRNLREHIDKTEYFSEKRTNISQVVDYVNNSYTGQNIGGVVIASDGLFNIGKNPLYQSIGGNALYTIGLGDSSIKKDVYIKRIVCNEYAYLGNDFPIQLEIAANKCNGEQLKIELYDNHVLVDTRTVVCNSDVFYTQLNYQRKADKPGNKNITARVVPLSNEISIKNNQQVQYIDIIDGREKILIAYATLHPDVGALKSAIGSNINYEVETSYIADLKPQEVAKYSLIILYQIPALGMNINKEWLSACQQKGVPLWFFIGTQSNLTAMPNLIPWIKWDRNNYRSNLALSLFNDNFRGFVLEENTLQTLQKLPPLKVPYGNFDVYNGEVILNQSINGIKTNLPLWVISSSISPKMAVTFGEGFWQWRLLDYANNENHFATNELVGKTVQYLTVKDDKRKFKVYPTRKVMDEDESIQFYAELYDANMEPVKNADIRLTLENEQHKKFQYVFSPADKLYQLNIGKLASGEYLYSAVSKENNEKVNGRLLVKPIEFEQNNTTADFSFLRQLANKNKGKFYFSNELNSMVEDIKANEEIATRTYVEKTITELISKKWIFILICLLLAMEWFIRKYEGGY